MHAGPLEALVHLHSEHSHVLSETEGTQSILVCRIASLWPEICGRWADRALELPRGKSTAPCHLSSPWHCACWNQATSPLQMRQYIRCWINEWWNLDRLKWKKKKSLSPTRLDCYGSTDGEWKSCKRREWRGNKDISLRYSTRYAAEHSDLKSKAGCRQLLNDTIHMVTCTLAPRRIWIHFDTFCHKLPFIRNKTSN